MDNNPCTCGETQVLLSSTMRNICNTNGVVAIKIVGNLTKRGGSVKRISERLQDGMVPALLTIEEWQSMRELPPPPTCMICGKESVWLMRIGYGSKHDGQHICPECLDRAIGLLAERRGREW